jgi:hypothetical protein
MKTLVAFAILLSFAIPAVAQNGDCSALTHQALELSGLNQSISDMTQMMNSEQFMQQVSRGQSGSSDFATKFKPIIMKDFDGSVMRRELEARLFSQCDPATMAGAISAMKSPLVSRMLAIEADAGKPENLEKNNRCVRAAQVVPPPDERMDAIAALDDSSGTSDLAADALIVMTRGMFEGAGIHFNAADYLARHRQDLKMSKSNALQVSMLCTYKSVPRAEILQYAKELSSAPLKTFYDQAKQAFLEVMEERAHAAGADLKTVITASAK